MRQSLGLIGCGAFGELMLRHIAPYFRILVHDALRDMAPLASVYNVEPVDLKTAAAADIVVLAVPVQRLEAVLREVALHVQPDALVLDVCSVKVKPARLLAEILPETVEIICTHPLFGPQSGKDGIAGLNIAICPVRGQRIDCVEQFLSHRLRLKVTRTSAERHDKELAQVQGLTHLIAKILVQIELADIKLTTRTYELLMQSVELVRYDSDELFRAIASENPFVGEAKEAFFGAARALEQRLEAAPDAKPPRP